MSLDSEELIVDQVSVLDQSTPKMNTSATMAWSEQRPINKASRERLAYHTCQHLDFIGVNFEPGSATQMLDYACGTGFLSRIFAPHISSIKAMDTSPTMVDIYNARVDELGDQHQETCAIVGNLLCDPPEPSTLVVEEYSTFDLVVVGAALHHFPCAGEAVKRLGECLRAGGVLYIQDLFASTELAEEAGMRPRGYTREEVEEMFKNAGFVDFKFELLPEEFEMELPTEQVLKIQCFAARAAKPDENDRVRKA
ncbi:S-adenosyl-L-methionine-dependent methyltransferase [Phaeosphaeriaceae sp. PMI808]|nr:S-adenosyl-L-methionine-dependent methyltransferase [Phaeosphaeriaceae sp. PMI808]